MHSEARMTSRYRDEYRYDFLLNRSGEAVEVEILEDGLSLLDSRRRLKLQLNIIIAFITRMSLTIYLAIPTLAKILRKIEIAIMS